MATVTTITYSSTTDVATTSWDAGLTNGSAATSAVIDNTSTNYVDILIGGSIETAGTVAAGDSVQIYVLSNYDTATSTAFGGAIGTAMAAGDGAQTKDTDFRLENLTLLESIDTNDASVQLHWGPRSVAAAFGGIMPQKVQLLIYNNGNTLGTTVASFDLKFVGITYTNT